MASSKLSQAKVTCVRPFTDRREILNQAGAIVTLLACAYTADADATDLANEIGNGRSAPNWAGLSQELFHDALEGVASLIAVAIHLEDQEG
ncbi:hypothetical protein [Sphingobium sp. WCS2017Hpa-17]|uniref:hypothetical protein n=1 Tax=Sphingobium sp. WCS2017Hpa-17 TaxID=3073638 RepID=UPI0028893BFC|nr:hypothetical protein [Sphingobium sp. WCS2017Hpa-17]